VYVDFVFVKFVDRTEAQTSYPSKYFVTSDVKHYFVHQL